MAESCAWIPRVTNKEGKKVDSKLFKDLLSLTSNNRELSDYLYRKSKSEYFIKEWLPKLDVDDNGEPTVASLLKKTNIRKYISEHDVIKKLNKDIGAFKRGAERLALWVNNRSNYNKLLQKVLDFNTNSPYRDDYVARVIKIQDSETGGVYIGINVERRNRMNSIEAEQIEYNENLNSKLRRILEKFGIKVGVLNDLEERRGINGVTDFSRAKDAAEGLIELIRLAKGERGEKALPEEFSHFIIEAMGDNPLITRLINLIASKGLAQEIMGDAYDAYTLEYGGNELKLAKEAAGKLLAKHLLANESIPAKPYKNLLERAIEAIKNFFSRFDPSEVRRAMREADKKFSSLATQILDGSLDNNISIENINSNEAFFDLGERISRDKHILENIIQNEYKRYKVYEERNPDSKFNANQQLFIERLETELAMHNYVDGIYTFLENANETLMSVRNRLIELEKSPNGSLKEKAKTLRNIRNYIKSYESMINEVRTAMLDEETLEDDRYGQRVRDLVDKMTSFSKNLNDRYNKAALPLVTSFLKTFVGDSVEVVVGKQKKKVSLEELHQYADKDISFFDRWLDSMGESSSALLRVYDQAVKTTKQNTRYKIMEVVKKIQRLTLQLEQAGIKDTDWMFERDDDGNLTGHYLQEVNRSKFSKAYKEMITRLQEKYGVNPVGQAEQDFLTERREWFNDNMEVVDGKKKPKLSLYGNPEFEELHEPQNKAKLDYYNAIMEIKAELDSYLPEGVTSLFNIIKIRKDLLERVKGSTSVSSGAKEVWESVKDAFLRRSDDIGMGNRVGIKDFEDREVQSLPIYYTKLGEGESMNDISTDIASTLSAYAAMALEYQGMNDVIDVLELGRDYIHDNLKVGEVKGDNQVVETFRVLGRKVQGKLIKPKNNIKIIDRLDDFFKMQVYRRFMDDEGTFGDTRIDKAKAANNLNFLSALNSLAINLLAGISNIATGKVMLRIEAFAKEFITESNVLRADRNYAIALKDYLGEIGNRVKVSKMALWIEHFDVMHDYGNKVRELNFDRKTWFSRMFNTSTLFFISKGGEHWLQTRTSLAFADAYKMKAPDGSIVSLWDAMEVVYLDENNPSLGGKLQVKKGYTKEDGTKFTQKDAIAFSKKVQEMNNRLHGIYNEDDMSAIQRTALGRMAIMYRKWIRPGLVRRFKGASYNYDLDAWTEGYYYTTGKFLVQLIKDLRKGQIEIATNWNQMSDTEKANVFRAITEVGHLVVLTAVLGLVDWDDDEDRPWLSRLIEYQARRLYTEIGAMVPGTTMLSEGFKILKSPAAAINTMQDITDLIGLMNPFNYELLGGEDAIIQSGRYKGESRATRLFFESPVIPMNKTIYRVIHPEEGLPFYK